MNGRHPIRVVGVLAAATVCGVYLVLAFRSPLGLPMLHNRWQEVRDMQLQNAELKRDVEMRRDRIRRLEENAAEQELEIRKQLKMLKPGETTFILPENAEKKQ